MSILSPEVIESVVAPSKRPKSASFRLTFPEVSPGYRPGWSFAYSLIAHEIAIFSLLFLSVTYGRIVQSRPAALTQVINLHNPNQVVYLPVLGGGSEGNGRPGGGAGVPQKVSSPAPAHSSKGSSYPGPQSILSNPPNPINPIQTLLQPGLKNPPILQQFVTLPNIVHMANAGPVPLDVRANKLTLPPAPTETIEPPKLKLSTRLPLEVMPSQVDLPSFHPASTTPIERPKLALPTSAPEVTPPLVVRKSQQHVAKNIEKPISPPRMEQISPVPARGTDLQTLVALSPMPALPGKAQTVPSAETRGRFGVSPEATITSSQSRPGSKLYKLPSADVGIGSQTRIAARKHGRSGRRHRKWEGRQRPRSPGNGGSGTDAGRGSAVGAGAGAGLGHNSGSGTGAGAGYGGGAFPGITIQGGSLGSGAIGKTADGALLAPQTSYRMTILSTASSGGGLADFGVFSNEKVYTVYIDIRQTAEDRSPSWTLQYAPLREAAENGADRGSSESPGLLVSPFAVTKEMPQLPVELIHKYSRRLIVVYAIIDTEGKLERMSVKQSPDARLSEPLLEALSKWVFQPAQLDGQPVATKVLLGIPLALSQ
jgi:hypothetical protein